MVKLYDAVAAFPILEVVVEILEVEVEQREDVVDIEVAAAIVLL